MKDFFIKRITLPSGEMVDVVCFGDVSGVTTPQETPDLCVCPECEGSLVQPVAWREFGDWYWHLELRCPDCGWLGSGVWDHSTVVAYDTKLCTAADDLIYTLEVMEREKGWRDG